MNFTDNSFFYYNKNELFGGFLLCRFSLFRFEIGEWKHILYMTVDTVFFYSIHIKIECVVLASVSTAVSFSLYVHCHSAFFSTVSFFLMKRAKKLVSFSFKKQKKVNSFYCSWPSHILWEQQVLVFIVACLNVRLAMKGSSHAMW